MFEKARKTIGILVVTSVIFFAVLAILSIWEFIDKEMTVKSLGTLAIIFSALLIYLVVLRITENKEIK